MSPVIVEKPKISIDSSLLESLEAYTSTEGQVVIHGICRTLAQENFLRIWPTTFLLDQHSDHMSELVHFEKISGFPDWTFVPPNKLFGFTLIFSALPKSCILFDLQEIIPQSNGFSVKNIIRNNTDVYYLDFSE